MGRFLVKVLLDDSILPEMAQKIFYEIISMFPTKQDRKTFGRVLLVVAGKTIDRIRGTLIIGSRLKEKIDAITACLEFYSPDGVIILQ